MVESRQTKMIEWDGKQKPLSWFLEELGLDDPDDDSNSWQVCYSLNGVMFKQD